MHLVEKSSCDEEEMTEQYYDAFSPEELNKLTESDIGHESDDAERQVQEEEETEELYFDAYSHEELIRKKTNLSKRNVGQELEDGDCEESSADIWIPPNERNGPYFNLRISESHEDSHISKWPVNGDQYITDFDTFLAKETNSEKGTELSVEQQSENSENSSVAVGIFSDQRERESIDTQMSESQSEMHNPEYSCFGEHETFLGKRTLFDNNLTESQDDTDNPESSSSVEEEEEKYFDSNLPKEYQKLPIYRKVSKQPAGVEQKIGGRKQPGNKLNDYGRDQGLIRTNVDARYPRITANCRVLMFITIEEYISPMSESKQLMFTIAMQVAAYGNSFDLVKIYGKTLHKYGGDVGLIRTKVNARYLKNVANCRVFVSIEGYISPISESEPILQTGNKLDDYGRDQGLIRTKVDARYPRIAANCRVFVSIEEYISPMSESNQLLLLIAMQVAAYGNSFDLVKIYGKTLHKYGGDLGLIRTKVNARYLKNVANCRVFVSIEGYISPISESEPIRQTGNKLNDYGGDLGLIRTKFDARYPRITANCRVFVSIEEYISPMSESKQLLFTAMVIVAACKISFHLTKSGNSAKSLHDSEKGIHQEEEHVRILYCFAKFEVFGGFDAKLIQQADQSDFKSIAFVIVESRGMIYPAQYFLKEMSQEVGKYSAYNPKCSMQPPHFIPQLSDVKFSMACEKNVMSRRIHRDISFKVETYKDGLGKIQTFTRTSNLTVRNEWKIDNDISVDNRCMGINTGTLPKKPDHTNDAKKYQVNGYKGSPHTEVAKLHFDACTECNKKVPSNGAQKIIVETLTFGDDCFECFANEEKKYNTKQVQPPETTSSLFMTSTLNQETLDGKTQDNINGTDEKHIFVLSKDLSHNSSNTEKKNNTPDELDKVHNALEQSKFETPLDGKIKKTLIECVKEKDIKFKDQVNKLPDVSQKKQSLDEDRKLQNDAMQWDVEEKKTSGIKINIAFTVRFWVIGLLMLSQQGFTLASNVCKETVKKVSHCPTTSDYKLTTPEKCTGVCGDSEGNYEYHCVRDSTETYLVELCAVAIYSFDYCVEYDEVGNLIQMDQSTLCNSSSKESYYKSSDVLFCDPGSCLNLPKETTNPSTLTTKNVSSISTTNSTNTKKRDIKPNQLLEKWFFVAASQLLVLMVIGFVIIFYKYKKHQTNGPSENEENDQKNPLQNDKAVVHPKTSRFKILLQSCGWNTIRNPYQNGNTQEILSDDVV